MNEYLANAILIPYLWWGGYAMDAESIAICRQHIEIQETEDWGLAFPPLLWLQSFEDLTPEQREEIKARIERTVRNSSSKEQTLADFLEQEPDFAPMRGGGDPSDEGGPTGKSWGGGGSEVGGSFQAEGIPFLPQKSCRCFPGCPNCSGDCTNCTCIFDVPSKSRWHWKMRRTGVRHGGISARDW